GSTQGAWDCAHRMTAKYLPGQILEPSSLGKGVAGDIIICHSLRIGTFWVKHGQAGLVREGCEPRAFWAWVREGDRTPPAGHAGAAINSAAACTARATTA